MSEGSEREVAILTKIASPGRALHVITDRGARDWAISSFEEAIKLAPEWSPAKINLGIATRSFDLDMRTAVKRPRSEGGIYDGDLAVRAAQRALDNAGLEATDIDRRIHHLALEAVNPANASGNKAGNGGITARVGGCVPLPQALEHSFHDVKGWP